VCAISVCCRSSRRRHDDEDSELAAAGDQWQRAARRHPHRSEVVGEVAGRALRLQHRRGAAEHLVVEARERRGDLLREPAHEVVDSRIDVLARGDDVAAAGLAQEDTGSVRHPPDDETTELHRHQATVERRREDPPGLRQQLEPTSVLVGPAQQPAPVESMGALIRKCREELEPVRAQLIA
jgi:hypothetical protein